MSERSDSALEQAMRLEQQGYEAFKSGDVDRSRELSARSLALARDAADPPATVRALAGLMRLALRDRDFPEVERLATECDEVADRAGDPSLRRMPIHMRAEAARMNGDLATARELYDASIDLNRQLGDARMVAIERANKSWIEIARGRLDEAETLLRDSLSATAEGDHYSIAFCLLGLARVELERNDEHGAEVLGAAEAVLVESGLVWDPAEQPEYETTLARARDVTGDSVDDRRSAGGERSTEIVASYSTS